jgi:SAM-dependent methyltransferase
MFKSSVNLKDYMKQFLKEEQYSYLEDNFERFFKTYELMKKYYSNQSDEEVIVDLGSKDGIFVPVINSIFPLKKIHIVDYGEKSAEFLAMKSSKEVISFTKHYLNLEKDPLPFGDKSVDVVFFCEILEHLLYDSMHVFLEINRVLKHNGILFISTPNLNSLRAIQSILMGNNPNLFTPYKEFEKIYERHNREFTIKEVKLLADKSGFSVEKVFTHPINASRKIKFIIKILGLLKLSSINDSELGNFMYVFCQKKQDLNLNNIDAATRYPVPIYRYIYNIRHPEQMWS